MARVLHQSATTIYASTVTMFAYMSIASLNGTGFTPINDYHFYINDFYLHMCGHVTYFPYHEMTISPLITFFFFNLCGMRDSKVRSLGKLKREISLSEDLGDTKNMNVSYAKLSMGAHVQISF